MPEFKDNRVVKDTGSVYPIIQAPMAWIARSSLVSAVSAAGALGILETSARDLDASKREYDLIKENTDRPFGINLAIKFLRDDNAQEKEILDWTLDGRVSFVTTSAGDPKRYINQIRDAGIKVYHAVPSLYGALKAEDAGVDGLIVEGGESGGIRGINPVHSFALLQAVRARVDLPVVAAGGIADGRGMAGAFALGAEGVAMGTRFVASRESPVHQAYKDAIVAAEPDGTLAMASGRGVTSRVLRTGLAAQPPEEKQPSTRRGNAITDVYMEGRFDLAMASAGESAGLILEVKSAQQIVTDTVDGFWREIARLAALAEN